MSDDTKPDLPVTTEDEEVNTALDIVSEDTTGTDVDTVADLVSALSLPTWIARNASKAFRQLCSAAVEWPSAFFEGKASERHAISEANTKITEAVTNQIIQQIQVPPEYAQIAVSKHIEKIIGEQINLDKISAIAANELKNSESNNPINSDMSESNKEQSAGSTNRDANRGEEKVISDEWLNSFETEARQKSTEEMQLRFGRVLAGEIEKPGSYSIKAVKILGEIDQYAASLFKNLCSMCIAFEDGTDGSVLDARILPLDVERGRGDLSKYNLSYYQLDVLSGYGLVGSTQNSLYPYDSCIEIQNHLPALPFRHQGLSWILCPFSILDTIQEFKVSGLSFSLAGRELLRIVDQDPIPKYTEALKKYFADQRLQMVEVPNL